MSFKTFNNLFVKNFNELHLINYLTSYLIPFGSMASILLSVQISKIKAHL